MKPKSLECIFLDFEKRVKGYKLWDPRNKKKVLSRDAVFDELTTSKSEANDWEKKDIVATEIPIIKEVANRENQPEEEEPEALEEAHVEATSLAQLRAKRIIKLTNRYSEVCHALLSSDGDPSCFQKAIESNER